MRAKAQRIRDPLHNLIEFDQEQFEQTIWNVIQTPPFQRLRRVRQLGFSEFVFPGATHTRFAHSVGVFHTARRLMKVISQFLKSHSEQFKDHQAYVALAAALVHDVGHGMFSHAFEHIGKKLNLPMAHHEAVTEALIRNSEITGVFGELGSGFATDVANVFKSERAGTLYEAVVSSQFDADRLDYMQRDRLMTGVQSSGIDATWLMANLEISSVQSSADDASSGKIETLVLGPKAFHAAENYVLSLFQLYPNVYLHKTTRGAEKLFSALMLRLIPLLQEGHHDKASLPANHPFCKFALAPNSLANALALDDTIFWGALPMLQESADRRIAECANRLRERKLPKCIDVRQRIEEKNPVKLGMTAEDRLKRDAEVRLACKNISEAIEAFSGGRKPDDPPILVDETRRSPYKKFQDSKSLLNQILIRQSDNRVLDMAHLSSVVQSAETFEVCRAYVMEDDGEGLRQVEKIIGENSGGTGS